jgi:HD-like signal output (HDOD) protein/signal transduction histidine kinase
LEGSGQGSGNNAGPVDTVKSMTVEKQQVPTQLTLNKLPSLPQVLVRILDAVSQESADFQQLSNIIRQDSGMSARLIAVANSSYYRRQHGCDSVDRALMCLGIDTVRTLVITAAVKQYFSYFDKDHQQFMARFWRRSLVSAHCAQTFATLTGYNATSQAYLCGLLMDVGQLCLLAENDSEYLPLLVSAGEDDQQLLESEQQVMGTTHCDLGALLLDSWQMDNFMADALRYHHAVSGQIKHAHHLVKIVNLSSLMSMQTELSEQTLAVANALFGFNEDLMRELHARIFADVQRVAGGLGMTSDEEPEQGQRANRELGEKLGQITQMQALRQAMPGASGSDQSGHGAQDAIGRALYLSFGFEKYVVFFLREPQGTLEASLGGVTGTNGTADFVLNADADESLVQRSFMAQQVLASEPRGSSSSSVLDDQLRRYCRQRALICLPFASKTLRGVVVAGANPDTLAHYQKNTTLWITLLQQVATLFDAEPGHTDSGKSSENSDSVRISEAVHEVSNPLSVINNYLEILRLKLGDSKDTNKEFSILHEEIDRVGKILLRLNKPDALPETETVDVNTTVEDLVRIFRESMCAARDIKVILQLDPSLEPVLLNKAELKQVLTNLIKNAVEAMPSGGQLTVQSQGRVMLNGRAYFAINIEDTGAGLSEQVMSKLFTPGITSKGEEHAGLGLSVVKKLMDAMNAQIDCSSSDKGARFRLLFPVVRVPSGDSRREN